MNGRKRKERKETENFIRSVPFRSFRSLPFLLLLSVLCLPAAAQPAARPATPNWLNLYELSSYKEEWTATLRVPYLKAALPTVLAAFKAQGAALAQPLENFASSKIAQTQQLSYRLSRAQAQNALDALKKDGFLVLSLRQAPAPDSASLPEINAKIKALMSERAAHRAALAKMPAVAALVDQMLSHLVMVKEVQERAQAVVILNLTVSGRG